MQMGSLSSVPCWEHQVLQTDSTSHRQAKGPLRCKRFLPARSSGLIHMAFKLCSKKAWGSSGLSRGSQKSMLPVSYLPSQKSIAFKY